MRISIDSQLPKLFVFFFAHASRILVCILLLFSISCQAHKKEYQILLYSNFSNEGFLNEDTLQIKSQGHPEPKMSALIDRRNHARYMALINAKKRALEYLLQNKIDEWQKKTNMILDMTFSEELLIKSKISQLIGMPHIAREIYQSDGSCALVARFHRKNLQKLITDLPLAQGDEK